MRNNIGRINILVIIIIILVQLIIAGGIYFYFWMNNDGEESPQRMQGLQQTDVPTQRREESRNSDRGSFTEGGFTGAKDYTRDFAIFNVGDIIVNPLGSESRFLVLIVLFEYRLADRRLPAELQNKAPMFRDRITQYFSRITIEDLRDVENRDIFRDDIIRVINNLLVEGRITDVFFEQFVLQ
ncbi:MAG: flagellar basal body-associated FliL family protein [Candidatus Cloacimonetes bacterium]|nr:flagellar basal body-associated FliL family protein [Candidatus Cloacimonadota bacterium]